MTVRQGEGALNIVVAYKSARESEPVLRAAFDEARRRSAHVHVVRVHVEQLATRPGQVQERQARLNRARLEIEELEGRLVAEDVDVAVELVVSTGRSPGEVLLERAIEYQASLMIIGVRRRSPVGKLVLGSEAQEVLLGADCPVLAIRVGEE
jgi:nucleotide-binding universal stress UspA family protein